MSRIRWEAPGQADPADRLGAKLHLPGAAKIHFYHLGFRHAMPFRACFSDLRVPGLGHCCILPPEMKFTWFSRQKIVQASNYVCVFIVKLCSIDVCYVGSNSFTQSETLGNSFYYNLLGCTILKLRRFVPTKVVSVIKVGCVRIMGFVGFRAEAQLKTSLSSF